MITYENCDKIINKFSTWWRLADIVSFTKWAVPVAAADLKAAEAGTGEPGNSMCCVLPNCT